MDNTAYNLTDIAAIGDTYIGEYYFNNITITNGARVNTTDNIFFDSINITGGILQGNNIYQTGSNWKEPFFRFAGVIKNFFRTTENTEYTETTKYTKGTKEKINPPVAVGVSRHAPVENPTMLATASPDLKGLIPSFDKKVETEKILTVTKADTTLPLNSPLTKLTVGHFFCWTRRGI